jgi:hypothetical protein
MDASLFDPQAFLDATLDTPSIRRPPLPVENPASPDGLYLATLGEPKPRTWQGKVDPSRSGVAFDVPINIDVPGELKDKLGLATSQITLNDSIMLDLTEQGAIDNGPGKNRRLRIYREAADLNKPGDVFSFRKLEGRLVKVKIEHDMYQGDIMDRVNTVLRP